MKNAVPIEDQLASIEAALPGLDAAGWPILRERLQGLLAQSAGQARWMARVHLALTRLHLFRSAPPEALAHADAALAAACEAGDDERRSRALLLRARAWYAAGDHAHALADVETLLAGEVADQSLRFDALQMLAACSIGLNELDDAWRWQTQAADLAEAAAKPNWRVHCLSNLGGIATLRAEREFQRGAHEACVSHAVIAESFTRRGLAEPSLEHMPPSRLSLLCNLASQLVLQQRFDEAGATFAAADALSVRLSLPVPPLNAAPFKARLLEARGDVAGALSCLEAALARGQALQAEASVLELHAELARLLKAQGRYLPPADEVAQAQGNAANALGAYREAARIAQAEGDDASRGRALAAIASVHEGQQRWDDARNAWQDYTTFADSHAQSTFPAVGRARTDAIARRASIETEYAPVRERIAERLRVNASGQNQQPPPGTVVAPVAPGSMPAGAVVPPGRAR
jgi:tetratricopeptide (TPR) repeat protein